MVALIRYLVFSVFAIFLILPESVLAIDPPPTPVGRVIWIKGTLKAEMPNKEVRSLQKTSVIYLHDTLITDNTSQAQIAFTDNTLMTFRQGTTFRIDQYEFKLNKKGSVGKYIMRLLEGGFRTITGLISKRNPNDYQVNTPVATIGVRGTDYAVSLKNKQLYIGYYSGNPCVSNDKGNKLCLDAKTRYGFVGSPNAVPVPLEQRPDVFREKLEIQDVKIEPFSSDSDSGTGPKKTSKTTETKSSTQTPSGTVSSFCIQ